MENHFERDLPSISELLRFINHAPSVSDAGCREEIATSGSAEVLANHSSLQPGSGALFSIANPQPPSAAAQQRAPACKFTNSPCLH
ncbi:hypothetical protein NYO67_8955 [Aspergillus flavus]|nr:hypothetical protein NYO67_8955 [Aspergillus flavus]